MRLLTVLVLVLSTIGCGGTSNEEDDSKVTLNKDNSNENGEQRQPSIENNPTNSETRGAGKTEGKPIPEDFPKDIPLDKDMICQSVTKVRDSFMITFHTEKTVAEITDWFSAKMGEQGWEMSGTPVKTKGKAILPYKKNDRTCGISVTGFVLNEAAQKDESMRGITIQTKAMQ